MKLVRKYMMNMGTQFQTVYIRSESVSEAIDYCKRHLNAVSVEFIEECPNRMTYDVEC